jgi:hypothetical protein
METIPGFHPSGSLRLSKSAPSGLVGLFVLMGGAFHVILSVVSAMTAAHPARVGRTRLDAGYLPERGGKRRRMSLAGGQYAKPLHLRRSKEVLHQTALRRPRPKPEIFLAISSLNWQ